MAEYGAAKMRHYDKVLGDDKTPDISHLLAYRRRLIFGFPYLYDPKATGWIVWDKQWNHDERTSWISPVEMASTTLRKGFDIIRYLYMGFIKESMPGEVRSDHPTQKPLKVMYKLIQKYTKPDDIIVDSYAGSGTTLVAAKMLGRHYIGFEIEQKYVDICNERLSNKQKGLLGDPSVPLIEEPQAPQ